MSIKLKNLKNLLLAAVFAGYFPVICSGAERQTYTEGDFRRISAMTAKILERNHYSGVRIDPVMSARIFDTSILKAEASF